MDGFGRLTIRNIKMWMEVDGWTDGRKHVRGGLVEIAAIMLVDFEVDGKDQKMDQFFKISDQISRSQQK